jgi:hypothetical protein
MKLIKTKHIIVMFVLALFAVTSCKKDDDGSKKLSFGKGLNMKLGKSQKEFAVSVVKGSDYVYVVGNTEADYGMKSDFSDYNGGYYDVYINKISVDGTVLWEKCFGDKDSEKAVGAYATPDGGLIVIGTSSDLNYASGGLAHLVGSADVFAWKIGADGEVQWKTDLADNGEDEYAHTGVIKDDELYLLYAKSFDRELTCKRIGISDGTEKQEKLIYDKYSRINRMKVDSEGGFLLVGSISNDAGIIKLSGSLDLLWAKSHGGSSGDIAYDIEETGDGYLVIGSTGSSQKGLGSNGLFPYYRIIHSPGTRSSEVYILKIDKSGTFKCTQWTSGNNNNVNNIGWQIGVGYLESGWAAEYPGLSYQPDGGKKLYKLSDNNYLILGTGTYHKNGDGVNGAGNSGQAKQGVLSMRVNPAYQMKDNRKDDVYITWEKEFYSNVMLSKNINSTLPGVKSVINCFGSYLFIADSDGDIMVSSVQNSEVEK